MSANSATRTFFAGLLLTVGALITLLCGLCTGFFQIGFIVDAISNASGHRGGGEFQLPVYTPIMLGGIPIVVGIGLFVWGRYLLGPSPARKPNDAGKR